MASFDLESSSSSMGMDDQSSSTLGWELLPLHNIFISYSKHQRDFVEQLCVELERLNHFPFFDQRPDSVPKGENLALMIAQAANQCTVVVIVLSRDYMKSKWPMQELSWFVQFQKRENPNLKFLPLFYKFSPLHLRRQEHFWMEYWESDERINILLWMEAVRYICSCGEGLAFDGILEGEFRVKVVNAIQKITRPLKMPYDTTHVKGCHRLCEVAAMMFERRHSVSSKPGCDLLGLYGMGGMGKTTICKALCNHFLSEFQGRVCHLELGSERPLILLKRALKALTGLREDVVDQVHSESQGHRLLEIWLGRQPVFLAVDNVENNLEQAQAYVNAGLSPLNGSKVLITSRSQLTLKSIFKHSKYCKTLPILNQEEAAELLLSVAAPERSLPSIQEEEQRVLEVFLEECSFPNDNASRSRQYHPLAIMELGAFLHANYKENSFSNSNNALHSCVYNLPPLQSFQSIHLKHCSVSNVTVRELKPAITIIENNVLDVPASVERVDDDDDDDNEDEVETWIVDLHACGRNKCSMASEDFIFELNIKRVLESILQTMGVCHYMLQEMQRGQEMVAVYHSQWQYLVNSISTRMVEQFNHFHLIHELFDGLVSREIKVGDSQAGMKVLVLCFRSLVELASSLEQGLVLLETCRRKEWWRTVLWMSDVTPDQKKMRRSNSFCVVLQQCEWSLDLVKLAFSIVQEHFAGTYSSGSFKSSTCTSATFKWLKIKHRLLLVMNGHDSHDAKVDDDCDVDSNKETSLVEGAKEDSKALLKSLNAVVQKFKPKKWLVVKVKEQEQKIISFLKMKLEGPVPCPIYTSYSTQIDHQDLVLKSNVGSGSFGIVSKREWLGEEVAVKEMRNICRTVFESEAGILAAVQHPNIVQLIGCSFIEENATGMLVMELMEQDLRTLIDRRSRNSTNNDKLSGPFPVIVAIDIMLQVAEAMQYLRECKVMHRDLKAANVLVRRCMLGEHPASRELEYVCEKEKQWMLMSAKEDRFVVKLADFGLAKYQAQSSRFVTKMAGTGAWRAPEVFKDDVSSIDYKWPADVYSFGVTCFEILTGGVPFEGVSPSQIYEKIISGERPRIHSGFPSRITELINRCWATKPAQRPDFSQVCKELWICKLEQFGFEVCAKR